MSIQDNFARDLAKILIAKNNQNNQSNQSNKPKIQAKDRERITAKTGSYWWHSKGVITSSDELAETQFENVRNIDLANGID